MGNLPKNIALVYDRVNKWGGAERVLLALHELFPDAPLYTSVYNPPTAPWASVFPKVIPSFLQFFPLAKTSHEYYPWLTPLNFEPFNFDGFDAVISVTSADAKGIITKPNTFHLCYCLTPTRYLWSHYLEYQKFIDPTMKIISQPLFNYLKYWDLIAAQRPDSYLAISNTVRERISTYYHRSSTVIYPPIDIDVYSSPRPPPSVKDFFLYVGRLISYKRPEIVIRAFNELKLPLVVVGIGHLEKKLKQLAQPHIHFAGLVEQSELVSFYQHSRAVIYYHEEDFGLVPIEAHAAGVPVIALNRGGASETVLHNQTGILINDHSELALKQAILSFDRAKFDSQFIKIHSQKFSKQRFSQEFVKVFQREWMKYKSTYMF